MNLATFFGVQGAAWTVSAACASGAHALGQAYMLIRSGMQDVVLCGGAQEVNWPSMASFDALGAFARHDGEPQAACRPFDAGRSGLFIEPTAAATLAGVRAYCDIAAPDEEIVTALTGSGLKAGGKMLELLGKAGGGAGA